MKDVVIVGAVRTSVGRFMGSLKDVPAYDLAALALNGVAKKTGIDPQMVEDVIMGQSYQNGEYVNIARMGLLTAGWPEQIPGITIDRRCCSGLDAVCNGAMKIQSNNADIVVAGGVESMSTGEFYLTGDVKWGVGGKKGMPLGHGSLATWGLPFYDRIQRARVMSQPESRYGVLPSMMAWAETAAKEEKISRQECDDWAAQSHAKALAAWEAGFFTDEIIPVSIPQRKGEPVLFCRDEGPRADSSVEKLARLKPIMGGVCTAGNSSSENDGAAAVVLMSGDKAKDLGISPMAKIISFAVAGADPRKAYETVPRAVSRALDRAGLSLEQMDLIEIQEAFAAQVLADLKQMRVRPRNFDRVNVNGSGISIGHPIACTGTRVLVSMVHEMQRRDARYGLECICGGGGLGIAAVIEQVR
ncbi:acetyl-CoA C-acyltransferase [Desulfotignum balticum]|uniref:acetyl-CoA C-acyltransferase n=1 Tax=Desulfotignum balticum TaxID=115781 RepID=UPI000421DD5D|nr:acetyl-CoA C-acyltransferase [Desulfotignum balticum]